MTGPVPTQLVISATFTADPLVEAGFEPYPDRFERTHTLAEVAQLPDDHKGVTVAVTGPNLETRAEYRFLRTIGADVVGMSTGPEAAYLKAVGVRVAGLSCITNVAMEHGAAEVSHDEVVQVGGESGTEFSTLLLAALPELIALAKGEK